MLWVKNRKTGQRKQITEAQWDVMKSMFPGTFEKIDPPVEKKYSEEAKEIIAWSDKPGRESAIPTSEEE